MGGGGTDLLGLCCWLNLIGGGGGIALPGGEIWWEEKFGTWGGGCGETLEIGDDWYGSCSCSS